MTFFALYLPEVHKERVELLRKAAEKLKIPFKELSPFSIDFAEESPVKKGDILYRVGRGKLLRAAEKFLIKPGVVTFHRDSTLKKGNIFTLMKNGIPVPKTIFCVTRKRDKLRSYVKKIGGYPIVLKVSGGTRGLGVMKIDTSSALFSMVDYLLAQNKFFTLCQYIRVKTSARFVVLGDNVIASYEYIVRDNDFRSNSADVPLVKAKKYSERFAKIAIQATKVLGLEFGGIDMLIKDGKPYVTELNFPCNFVRAQKLLKKDVALEMVKFLVEKRKHEN